MGYAWTTAPLSLGICATRTLEQPPAEQLALAVEVFRMLADATRVRLLWALLDKEVPVGQLSELLGKPQATALNPRAASIIVEAAGQGI